VIKETARIIEQAVAEKGTPEDFVGPWVATILSVITVPDRMRAVCEEVIQVRPAHPEFYDEMDRTKGHNPRQDPAGRGDEVPPHDHFHRHRDQ